MAGSLDDLLTGLGVERVAYQGHDCPLTFDGLAVEYAAFDRGAALYDAGFREDLVAVGSERVEFLHGQLSQDLKSLSPGFGSPALLLTPQGRPVALVAVYDVGESLWLVTDRSRMGAMRAALERFLVADDCEFEEPAPHARIGLAGPQAAAILDGAGLDVDFPGDRWGASACDWLGASASVLLRGDLRVPSYEILVAEELGAEAWETLENAGATASGTDAYEVLRVESGTARYGVDIDEQRIAMEARLEWSIHFAKGCYVGQEVVERAVSRGRLRRQLSLLGTDSPVEVGARIAGGGDNDTVTSVVQSPEQGHLALAYRAVEAAVEEAESDAPVEVETSQGVVTGRVRPWPRPLVYAGRT